MIRRVLLFTFATVAVPLTGCTITTHDAGDCGSYGDYCWNDDECADGLVCGEASSCETDPNATGSSSGGGDSSSSGGGGDGGSGASSGSGGAGGAGPTPCVSHEDCNNGSYCDEGLCLPGAIPCADLPDETACAQRNDCEPVYAGINCSCGPNCQCEPGEAGCVCEDFEYFACTDASTS